MEAHPFQLPIAIDLAAVFLMALTGAIEAIRREYDIIGLFVLSLATGVGGALIRDGVFLQRGIPAVLMDDRYLIAAAAAAVLGLAFGTRAVVSNRLIALVDALALGAYAVVGVEKTLHLGLGMVPAVLVGVVNACGGGVLRDLFSGERPMVFKPGQFYAFAALIGCIIYIPLRRYNVMEPLYAALISIAVTFGLRVLAINLDWTTRPVGETGILRRRKRR
ncbi:trimeric intracellular cation channel family protein [Fundidesulfovibrio terrae]|uniref:trimeric intracellular cation channel family protein n=1 Tax=Fundidesulfovibrio terrae TaxID=2922866 RepID=UPI001FAE9DA8|nr:TRIC cation channel family protein [Fundidesulfovibrio terrae]